MTHKLIVTSLVAFFPYTAQLPVAMCVVVLYMILIYVFGPFLRKGDDLLQLLSLTEIVL